MWDVIREFVWISLERPVRGERLRRAIQLMVELRKCGFSSGELAELSGGRWKSSTIREYTCNVGGD
jgi:hypothetical protein